jgi:small-conductance mechanosensitive channel
LTRAKKTIFVSLKNIIDVFLIIIAILLILAALNVEITPLIASLGIGGLAVALALQPTIANYFSGLYITADRSIKVGDYIELENGMKGYVENISWRSTKIRTLPNNLVIIPNSKLTDMIVTNYYDPVEEMSIVLQCGVSYSSDLEKVEKVTIEVAKEILSKVEGGVKEFEPFIRYHTFGDSNIEFSIILRVRDFVSKYLITHEFIKALKKRYDKEGIEISFPARNIYMRGNQ